MCGRQAPPQDEHDAWVLCGITYSVLTVRFLAVAARQQGLLVDYSFSNMSCCFTYNIPLALLATSIAPPED